MTTGEKIKHFRNLRGISQETLGQLSGVPKIKKERTGLYGEWKENVCNGRGSG